MSTEETTENEQSTKYSLKPFFELSSDLLCIAGFDGYFKKINPALSKLLGYSKEELMAHPINSFIHPEDQKLTEKHRNNIRQGKPLLNFENRYLTKDGKTVWLSWTSIPHNEKRLVYAVAKDITHRKKHEKQRNQLVSELTQANQRLKQLTYTTSHDLRSPVNSLLSVFNLIDTSNIQDEETLELIGLLKKASDNLKKTLDNYVDDLNDFNIVTFNQAYLESIFLNLITNSIKYAHPDRNPVISITSKKVNGKKQLIFSDNGRGFDDEKTEGKIFGLHQKFHDHTDSKGIGLYLVYNHITNLGGKISVESKVDEGTTFTLTFND